MKKSEKKQFHGLKIEELQLKVREFQSMLAKERLSLVQKKSKNTRSVRMLRRTLAVIQTILRDIELRKGASKE